MNPLVAALAARAAGPLYAFGELGDDHLDADALRGAARALAARLGDERGRPVALVCGPGREAPIGLFGVWEAGATAVPLYPPADEVGVGLLAAVLRDCGARVVVALPALLTTLVPALGRAGVGVRGVPLPLDGDGAPGPADGEDALLLYTSGSTGAPKGAVLDAAGLVENMRRLAAACGRGPHDVVCTWLPHAHVAGLYTRLLPVVTGGRGVYLSPTTFAQRPLAWLEALDRHRATVTAAPDFAYALVAQLLPAGRAAGLDLSCLELVVSGGEPVRATTVDAFFGALAPSGLRRAAFHPYYGLTETLCTSIPQGRAPGVRVVSRLALAHGRFQAAGPGDPVQTFVSNGPPLPGTEVVVVDPDRAVRRPAGTVGELWTRGPGVVRAYTGDPARSAATCAARLADGTGPWFRTGDLGVVEEGEVYVTGRLKELLIVRGKNHYPADLEATVTAACAAVGVRDCAAFAADAAGEEALGLAIEVADADPAEVTRLARRAVAARHGLAIAGLYLVPVGTLPRTPTRKLSRHTAARVAASGAWDAWAVAELHRSTLVAGDAGLRGLRGSALRRALEALVLRLSGVDALDTPLAELGLGSIEVAGLAAALRRATGVEPPLAPFYDGSTLRGYADALAARLDGEAPVDPVEGWRELLHTVIDALPTERPPVTTGAVFLTGGTGFLGAWLLAALLDAGHEVLALARADTDRAAETRLLRALAAGPGVPTRGRLRALAGDLRAPRFGLAPERWAALADEVGVVVHNAADVNFVAPYAALRATNVEPLVPLLALAAAGGVARPVHLVSTTAVFNTRNRREQRRILGTDRIVDPSFLYSGYARSKWVAEGLARVAGHFALPVVVHRPGLIVGASTTGQAHADDFLSRLLQGCVRLGVYPDVAVELDLVAVDDVARGIAAAVAGPPPSSVAYHHHTTAQPTSVHALFAAFAALGHPLRAEPLGAWLDRIRTTLSTDNPLFPVHPFLLERPAGAPLTLLELLDGLPLDVDPADAAPCPPVDLSRLAAWHQAAGLLPTPAGSR